MPAAVLGMVGMYLAMTDESTWQGTHRFSRTSDNRELLVAYDDEMCYQLRLL